MPQALVCRKCMEPFVFTGSDIELVGESRIGYRHRCGAVNELQYVGSDGKDAAIYRIAGLVRVSEVGYATPNHVAQRPAFGGG